MPILRTHDREFTEEVAVMMHEKLQDVELNA